MDFNNGETYHFNDKIDLVYNQWHVMDWLELLVDLSLVQELQVQNHMQADKNKWLIWVEKH